MNPLRTSRIVATLALFTQCHAVDASYSFREIQLGDELSKAEKLAQQRFDHVRIDSMRKEMKILIAGDAKGFQLAETVCPTAAPSHMRSNCLQALFSTRPDGALNKVQFINVNQSFHPAVPLDVFLTQLHKTYGTPRVKYETPQNTPQTAAIKTSTYLWGGKKTPKNYVQSAIPWDDFVLIGGKFISIEFNTSDRDVIGYRLRIADSEKLQKFAEEVRNQMNLETERAKKENTDSIKF